MKSSGNGFTLLEVVIGTLIVFVVVSSLAALFIDLSRVTARSKIAKEMARLAKQVIDANLATANTPAGYETGVIPTPPPGFQRGSDLLGIIPEADPSLLGAIQYRQIVTRVDLNFAPAPPAPEAFKLVQLEFKGPYDLAFSTSFLVPKP